MESFAFTEDEEAKAEEARKALFQMLGEPSPPWAHHIGMGRNTEGGLVLFFYVTRKGLTLPPKVADVPLEVVFIPSIRPAEL